MPTANGRYLMIGAGRTRDEVAKFSRNDATRLDDYGAALERIADVLRSLILATPPIDGGDSRGAGL